MSKRVLLTGVGGFIGAHCLEYFLNHTDWEIIGIDSFRHKGTYRRVEEASKRHLDFIKDKNDNRDRFKVYYHDLAAPIDDQLEKLILNRRLENGNIVQLSVRLKILGTVFLTITNLLSICWSLLEK